MNPKSAAMIGMLPESLLERIVPVGNAADMNVLLTYYKCRDDWEDEKKVTALGYSKVLQGKVKKLDQKYPDKSRRIQKLLSELSEMEKSGEKDIDKMAGCFGKIMEEIFAWKQDVWMHTMMWKRI